MTEDRFRNVRSKSRVFDDELAEKAAEMNQEAKKALRAFYSSLPPSQRPKPRRRNHRRAPRRK